MGGAANASRKRIDADVVVVGAGIGGAMVAHKQAQKGKEVVVVDRGMLLDDDVVRQVFEKESFLGCCEIDKTPVRLKAGMRTATRYLPAAVGGLARFYAAVSMRMREAEFRRWPLDYEAIEPYYAEAEQLMQVSGIEGVDVTEPPRSSPFPNRLPPMSGMSTKLSEAAVALEMHPFQHPFAIRFDDCDLCNYCNQVPCPSHAKWSPDDLLASLVGQSVTVRGNTEATQIVRGDSSNKRKVDAVLAVDRTTGEELELRADNFVLAGGAFFTPALLLRSGFGEGNPLIGTHLMTHCLGLSVGIFPRRIVAEGGFHKWFSVGDYYFDDSGGVNGMIQQEHLTTKAGVVGRLPRVARPPVEAFYYRVCQLLVIAEDEPRIENRVEFPSSGRFEVKRKFSSADKKRRAVLLGHAGRIMRSAGALATFGVPCHSVYHVCGTARMGADPKTSVTDERAVVRGTDNLFVADASLFPTSGGVNPSLTVAALALKVASGI